MNNTKSKTSIGEFFSGLDYITIITAIISSVYGFILVYSALYSKMQVAAFVTLPLFQVCEHSASIATNLFP